MLLNKLLGNGGVRILTSARSVKTPSYLSPFPMPGTEELLTKLEFTVIIHSKSFGVIVTCIAKREKQRYRVLFCFFHSFCFLLDLARLLEELKKKEEDEELAHDSRGIEGRAESVCQALLFSD